MCSDILINDNNNKKATSFTDSTKPINNKITKSTKNDYESGLSNRIKIMNLSQKYV